MPSWFHRLFLSCHPKQSSKQEAAAVVPIKNNIEAEDQVIGPRYMEKMMGFNDSIEIVKAREAGVKTVHERKDSIDPSFQPIRSEAKATPQKQPNNNNKAHTIAKDLEVTLGHALHDISQLRTDMERLCR